MKSAFIPHVPLIESFALWNRFALDHASMLLAAGDVIGRRTTQMVTHGIAPNAAERDEMQRMVEEKQTAVFEGSLAAWQEWMRLAQVNWFDTINVAMRNGVALAPLMAGMNPANAMARSSRYAQRATARSVASAKRQWTAPLDSPVKIADAAFAPVRARVTANQKRLSA